MLTINGMVYCVVYFFSNYMHVQYFKLLYGCETWSFTPELQARINGANATCLARITGKSIHQEASARTQTFDINEAIRQRKWKWLGHVLRYPGAERLTKMVIKFQFAKGDRTNMLQDIPAVASFEQLVRLAQDRQQWHAFRPQRRNFGSRKQHKGKPSKYSLRSACAIRSETPRPQPPRTRISNKPSAYRN